MESSWETRRLFEVKLIVEAKMKGEHVGAERQFAETVRFALPILRLDDIIALHSSGLEEEACDLYAITISDGPCSFRIDDIARLCAAGLKNMASDMYTRTVSYLEAQHHFSVAHILKLYALGLVDDARDLYTNTVDYAPPEFVSSNIAALYKAGLHAEARDLFDKTARFSYVKPCSPNISLKDEREPTAVLSV